MSQQQRIPRESTSPARQGATAGATGGATGTATGLAVLMLCLLSFPASPSADEPELAAALREQEALLSQVESADQQAQQVATLLSGVEDNETNPRIAPRTPIPRDLPVAIFDEEKVVVPEGAWGNNKRMSALRRVLDADGDGKPEVERYIDAKTNLMVRQVEDRNYDGVQDAWSDFEWGAVTARVLDTNDDGNPDTWELYADGRMTKREVDRDDDGVRDAWYIYEDDSLVKEMHDANNDGKLDQVIRFQGRRRTRSEEDQDRDGQMDVWTFFASDTPREIPSRIERDTKKNGVPDTFEHFETATGKAILVMREQDVNGDGKIDIVSIYQRGKLVRREIADPALMPGA